MLPRALNLLRCPTCLTTLSIAVELRTHTLAASTEPPRPACERRCSGSPEPPNVHATGAGAPCDPCWRDDIEIGILRCQGGHLFPIVGGVPRMEPTSLRLFRDAFSAYDKDLSAEIRKALGEGPDPRDGKAELFDSTRTSFSLEWGLWQPGDKTWVWNLAERKRIFSEDIDLPSLDLSKPRVVLDAGCGNGQLSAGMATLGLEVFALDLSSGVERAQELKSQVAGDRAPFVHYVQGNLTAPPFEPGSFDVVYSSGVLHHTPSTETSFRKVLALTKPGGRGYVWLYSGKRKPVKRVLTRAIRTATIRMSPIALRELCEVMAAPLNSVTGLLTRLGVRETQPRSAREMAVSLYDELSPRYQHHHDEEEVARWYTSMSFGDLQVCSIDRNGFGMRAFRSPRLA